MISYAVILWGSLFSFMKKQERQTSHRGAYFKELEKIEILDRTGEDFKEWQYLLK